MVVKITFDQEYRPFRMTLIFEWHQHWYPSPEDSTVWMRELIVFAGVSPVVYLGNDHWGTTAGGVIGL